MSAILAQARLRACRHWPFASHAILSMVPVPRPGLGTLAVDQHWRLYYDDAVLDRMGTEQAAGLILHELDHLLKRHHKRGRHMVTDHTQWPLWNSATDANINSGLRTEGIPLPDGLVYPEQFNLAADLSAEEYFRHLSQTCDQTENRHETQPETNQTPADRQGNANADHRTRSRTDAEGPHFQGDDASRGNAQHGSDSPQPGNGSRSDCGTDNDSASNDPVAPQPLGHSGSCSDGRQRPWELGPPDDDHPGLDEADQQQLIHVTAKNVAEKQCGNGAAGHRRWAEEILNPPVDPATRLMGLVRRYAELTVGLGERTYRRPSRRNSNPRMALPSNAAPLPRITVVVDTSGSMGADDLGLALGMIRKVLNSFRIRDGIRVVTGDTEGKTKQLCLSDPRLLDLQGGGGTDMRAIVDEVLDDRPQPHLVIVCTDGWTRWPTQDTGVPVVACVTNPLTTVPDIYQPPGWITTLELSTEN